MKNNIKTILVAIAILLFTGILTVLINNAYMSRIENVVSIINGNNLDFDTHTITFNELDASGQKYTAQVNFISFKEMKEIVALVIEKDVKALLSKKSITEIDNTDITGITSLYKNNGIIITSLLINTEQKLEEV